MPRLPEITPWSLPTLAPPQAQAQLTVQTQGLALGEVSRGLATAEDSALSAFGKIDQAGRQLAELGQHLNTIDQQQKLIEAQTSLRSKLNTLSQQYVGRVDYDTMGDAYKKDAQEAIRGLGDGLQGKYRAQFLLHVESEVGQGYAHVAKTARDGKVDTFKAAIEQSQETLSREVAESGFGTPRALAARNSYAQQLEAAFAVGAMTPVDVQKHLQAFDEKSEAVAASNAIMQDPMKGWAMLKDPKVFPNLDPQKRINLQQTAIARAQHEELVREHAENRAQRLQEKAQREAGALYAAQAAQGKVSLDELRKAAVDGRISATDFNHGVTLLKQWSKGDTAITNQDSYIKLYRRVNEGSASKDDIVEAPDIAPEDKIKLLKESYSRETRGDTAQAKADKSIIKAEIVPEGLGVIHDPAMDRAYSYAVAEYDKLTQGGMPGEEARVKVIGTWQPRSLQAGYGTLRQALKYATADMDEAGAKAALQQAVTAGRISKDQAVTEFQKWKQTKYMLDFMQQKGVK